MATSFRKGSAAIPGFLAGLVSFVVSSTGAASDSMVTFTSRTDLTVSGLYRYVNQVGLSQNGNDNGDGVFIGQVLGRLKYEDFQLEAQPGLRFHYGTGANLPASDPSALSIRPPDRLFPLQYEFPGGVRQEAYLDLDRLNLSVQTSGFLLYAGRRPVSLGLLKIFPVWNKFLRPSPVAVGPEAAVFSQDGAGARFQSGEFAASGFLIKGANSGPQSTLAHQDAQIAELTWFGASLELHALGAQWWRSPVFGLAASTDWLGAAIRLEGLLIGPTGDPGVPATVVSAQGTTFPNPATSWRAQLGLGAEVAFNEALSGIVEGLWQQKGAATPEFYTLAVLDPFQVLRAQFYSFEQLRYKLTPFLTLSPGLLDNWSDLSHYALLRAGYSLSDSTELALTVAGPLGNAGSEFATQSFLLPNETSVGAPFQTSLEIHFTF